MNINTENKQNILQIQVYDSFTIDYNKYPRKDTPKFETDKVLIQFLMNQDYLEKVAKSYTIAIQFFNECKEYYFILKSLDGKNSKRYSAKEIMFIINQISLFSQQNPDIYSIQKYLRNFHPLDQLYYILIKNKDFYLELFRNVTDAKYAFFERREINYKFFIPFDFYGDIKSLSSNKGQVYTAIELLEINAYTQFLVKNKIIKNLPEPLFMRNYFDINPYLKKTENKKEKEKESKQQVNKEEIQEKNKSIFIQKSKTIENDYYLDLERIIQDSYTEKINDIEEQMNYNDIDDNNNNENYYDEEYEYNGLKNNNNNNENEQEYKEYKKYDEDKNKEENKKIKKNKKEKKEQNELKEYKEHKEIKKNNLNKKQENIENYENHKNYENMENNENINNDIKIIYFHK